MVTVHPASTEVWSWLGQIPDPEIPAISITDLGIVRDVRWNADGETLQVTITPTYSGCPATEMIARDITRSLRDHGVRKVQLRTQLSPAWTTDWISEHAKERLRQFGIASPANPLVQIEAAQPACPRCGSRETQVVSRYGSTPCKALYKCRACLEPFDVFKRH